MAKKERQPLGEAVTFDVELELTTPQLGTIPYDPQVFKQYIESLKPKDQEDQEDESQFVKQTEIKGWTGFMRDKKGLFIKSYMIKGFLKHAGDVLKDQLGIRAMKSKIDDYIFITPLHLYPDPQSNGNLQHIERSLRVMTMQGPRVTLARSDYLPEGTKWKFKLINLWPNLFKEKLLKGLFAYGKLMGLGQFRNGNYGAFELRKFEKV